MMTLLKSTCKSIYIHTDSAQLMIVQLKSFQLYYGVKATHIHRHGTGNVGFGSSPGLAMCCITISCDAGQEVRAAAPNTHEHKGEHLIPLQPFCTCTPILFFIFNTLFNKLHKISNTIIK